MARNFEYKNNYSLFKSGVAASPQSYRANSAYAWESLLKYHSEEQIDKKTNYINEAEKYFRKALAIWNGRFEDHYNLAVIMNIKGNIASRDSFFLSGLTIHPNDLICNYNLGVSGFLKGNYTEAKKYWQTAYTVDKNYMELEFKMGLINQHLQNYKEAIYYYEHYYASHPEDSDVVKNLIICYQAIENWEERKKWEVVLSKGIYHQSE